MLALKGAECVPSRGVNIPDEAGQVADELRAKNGHRTDDKLQGKGRE